MIKYILSILVVSISYSQTPPTPPSTSASGTSAGRPSVVVGAPTAVTKPESTTICKSPNSGLRALPGCKIHNAP